MMENILNLKIFQKIKKSEIFYGMFIFSGIRILQNSISLLLVPIYINALPQKEYGALDMLLSINAFVVLIFMFQIECAIYRFYYTSESENTAKEFISSHLLAVSFSLGVGGSLMLLLAPQMSTYLIPSIKNSMLLFVLVFLTLIPRAWITLLLIIMQLKKQKRHFAIIIILDTFVTSIAAIIFVVFFKLGIHGVLLGQLIGTYIACFYAILITRKELVFCFSSAIIKRTLHYSLPFMPGMFFGWAQVYSSRFIMRYYNISLESIATYALAFKFLVVINLSIYALNMAWQPKAMELIGSTKSSAFYSHSYQLYTVAMLTIGCIGTVLVKPFVIIIAPISYINSSMFVPVMISVSIISSAPLFLMGTIIMKKTIWNSVATFIGFVLYILCMGGIPYFGIWAVVIGSLLGSMMTTFIMYVISQKLFHIPYGLKTSLSLMFGALSLCLLPLLDDFGFNISGRIFLIAIILVLCLFVLNIEDRKKIVSFVSSNMMPKQLKYYFK